MNVVNKVTEPSIARVFKIPNYRLFCLSTLALESGTQSLFAALAWMVLQLEKSPVAIGTATALYFLPMLVATPVAGAMSDRFAKKKLLVWASFTRMVTALLLAALTMSPHLDLWQIFGPVLVLGIADAVTRPTRMAFLPEIVGRDNLISVTGLNSALGSSARFVGPSLGGVVIASLGLPACFVIGGICLGAGAVSYLAIRARELHPVKQASPAGAIGAQLKEGLKYATSNTPIAVALSAMATVGLFGYNFGVVIPLLARDVLAVGPLKFGLLSSALALGSMTAAMIFAASGAQSRRRLFTTAVGFCGLLALLGASRSYPLSTVILFFVGLSGNGFMNQVVSTIQLGAEDRVRGRIMSFYTLLLNGSTPLGALITTTTAGAIGIRGAVWANSVLAAVGIAFALLIDQRARRNDLKLFGIHSTETEISVSSEK